MNLATEYLGLSLRSPLVVGASPFCDDTFVARRLEESGAGAVVMRSLFLEQFEPPAPLLRPRRGPVSATEATAAYPEFADYQLSADEYFRQLASLRANLTIPVIASLGGTRPGRWTTVGRQLADAGASAIELNLYHVATDPAADGDDIEARMLAAVSDLSRAAGIPISVKLSPFHTSLPQFAKALGHAGAEGLVLFNRFYQPDINPEDVEVQPVLKLSDPQELLLRLRWLAILSPHQRGSLAASGGVHSAADAVKALLAGADAVQVVSVLLRHGPHFLSVLNRGIADWMSQRGHGTIDEFRGLLDLGRCPDPAGFERANYLRILQRWKI